jgi:hypothetical protein
MVVENWLLSLISYNKNHYTFCPVWALSASSVLLVLYTCYFVTILIMKKLTLKSEYFRSHFILQ